MKLTYWVALDSKGYSCDNIRAKTKKEVVRLVKEYPWGSYEKPVKMTIEYKDSFDLLDRCLSSYCE